MMELVVDGLKSVTVRAPDYETLMVHLPLLVLDLGADIVDSSSKPLVDSTARLDSISRSVKLLSLTSDSLLATRFTRRSQSSRSSFRE